MTGFTLRPRYRVEFLNEGLTHVRVTRITRRGFLWRKKTVEVAICSNDPVRHYGEAVPATLRPYSKWAWYYEDGDPCEASLCEALDRAKCEEEAERENRKLERNWKVVGGKANPKPALPEARVSRIPL